MAVVLPAGMDGTEPHADGPARIAQLLVDAYTRTDVSAEWRFTSRLSATATGQNLFHAAHAEFAGAGSFLLVTKVARSASLRLRWRF